MSFATMQARRRKAPVTSCEPSSSNHAWQTSDRLPATPQRWNTRPGSASRPGSATRPGSASRPGSATRPGSAARPASASRRLEDPPRPPAFDVEPLPLPAANLPFDADGMALLSAEAQLGNRSRLQDTAEVIVVEEPSPMSCRGGQQPTPMMSPGGKPIVEGMLLKRPGGFRGWFGNTAWRERHFRLDSRRGVFEYWFDAEARYTGSSPRRSLLLSNLETVEQLEERLLSLNFAEAGGGKRVVQVRVPETANFNIWLSTLREVVNSDS
mmetsp:Transcript_131584/g.232537  ORF Transcript_131584/g.232537 Transcript_131584/m.232537 type:complete len:268 (-) Transcript_131584:30-833(-)